MAGGHVIPRPADVGSPGSRATVSLPVPGPRLIAFFALVAWAIDFGVRGFQRAALGHVRVWNAPSLWLGLLAYLVAFALLGAVLALLVRVLRGRGRAVALAVLAGAAAWSGLLLIRRLDPGAALLLAAGLGVQFAHWAAGRPTAFDRLTRRGIAVLGVLAAVAVLAAVPYTTVRERVTHASLPAARADAPNVLFLILDTVRARSLSLYGYPRPTTPRLSAIAQGAVTFERAYSAAPWTVPGHITIFSGRLPVAMTGPSDDPLPDGPVLAEAFSQAGYATAGFVANLYFASSDFGLDRGFARYDDHPVSLGQLALSTTPGRRITDNGRLRRWTGSQEVLNRKTAARIAADFLDWQAGIERPFFAFLNFYDGHEPYLPPPAFEARFVEERPTLPYFNDGDRAERVRMEDIAPAEVKRQRDMYDAALASLDHEIGALLDELDRRGVLDRTIVVVSSDHGEEFMEHGRVGHTKYVYSTLLRVPLVIRYPAAVPGGVRIAEPVALADLAATTLALADVRPASEFPGRSLARFWARGAQPQPAAIVGEADADPGNRKSLVQGRYHYIRNPDGWPELYDVATDPLEARDLARDPRFQDRLLRMGLLLDSLLDASSRAGAGPGTRTPDDDGGDRRR